jgi:hypothetical protein
MEMPEMYTLPIKERLEMVNLWRFIAFTYHPVDCFSLDKALRDGVE